MTDDDVLPSLMGLVAEPACQGCGRISAPGGDRSLPCPGCGLLPEAPPGTSAPWPSSDSLAFDALESAQALQRVLDNEELTGRYEVLRKLGHGGMGAIYAAKDRRLNRPVALKLMLGTGPADLARFLREAQLLAQLDHPNVLRIFNIEVFDQVPVLVLELLEGRTLKADLARAGRCAPARVKRVITQVLEGLEAAHRLGIVHRDLKAENILVLEEGDTLKILDFGLARRSDPGPTGVTQRGAILGTPAYMSPEQCSGAPADSRSDLYSLGVVMFELLTGRLPFTGSFPMEILVKHLKEEPPSLAHLVPGIPAVLEAVVRKALAKDPTARFADAHSFRQALAGVSQPGESEVPAAPPDPARARPTELPFSPSFLERYRIDGKLGEGGMGVVFSGTQLALDRRVAIKTLRHLAPEQIERFRVEGKLLSKLDHPRIVTVHDAGEDAGVPFLVCELVEGETLHELARREPLGVERAVAVTIELLEGLAVAHARNIYHRDIKPQNVFITREGSVKIGDFGLARLNEPGGASLTQSGIIMGTPAYMSPEQGRGQTIDGRSDLYAAGIVLYQLLTRVVPFQASSAMEVIHQQIHAAPVPPRSLVPELPPRLDAAVLKALRKNPDERFRDANGFAAELGAVLKSRREAVPLRPAAPATPPVRPSLPSVGAPVAPPAPVIAAPASTPLPRRSASAPVLVAAGILAVVAVAFWRNAGSRSASDASRHGAPATPVPVSPATPGAPVLHRHATDGAELILIPAGTFVMGPEDPQGDQPGQPVTLPAFYIERMEVTRGQYRRFLEGNSGHRSQGLLVDALVRTASVDPQFPVTGVTWEDARAYAAWAGRRLPTEAEWERAARGTDGRSYPWGDEPPDGERAVFLAAGAGPGPYRVGSRPPGAAFCGCLDMAGNVWEWCAGWDAEGAVEDARRVLRGGGFRSPASTLRCTFRWSRPAQLEDADIGFRTAMSAGAP